MRLITVCELKELLSVSSTTIRRWVKAGCFPAPIRLGEAGKRGSIRWRSTDVEEWIKDQPGVTNFDTGELPRVPREEVGASL